jgi:type III secretion system (T3SS) SseB-like protein
MLTVTDGKPRQPYRLIVNNEKDRMDVLTIQLSTGKALLPVFSHDDEAETFVRLESSGTGWRVRETSARELVSVLLGPGADIGWVVLDPWPGIHVQMVVGLIGVKRSDFVNLLVSGIEASRSTARGHPLGVSADPSFVAYPVVDDGVAAREGLQAQGRDPAEDAAGRLLR